MAKKTTIYDIAEAAGTSPSTVSRVLNGSSLVHGETARQVRGIAEDLNYVSRRVRRPANRAILHIVVFLPHKEAPQTHLFYDAAMLFDGIRSGFGDTRHHLIVSLSGSQEVLEAKKLGDIDGCLFSFCSPDPGLHRRLAQRDIPFVLINRASRGMNCVCNDAADGMRNLVETIGAVRPQSQACFVAVRSAGPVAETRAAVVNDISAGEIRDVWFESVAAIDASTLGRLHSDGVRVFMAMNDYVAIAVRDRLGELGLRIPDDVGLTGYDAAPVSGLFSKKLVTVDLAVGELGRRASTILCDQIVTRSRVSGTTYVQGRLIEGETL